MPNILERTPAGRRGGTFGRLLARRRPKGAAPPQLMTHAEFPGVDLPPGAGWAWRPNPWAVTLVRDALPIDRPGMRFSADAEVFFDGETLLGQIEQLAPPASAQGQAPFGVAIDVGRFDGSFLSLAIEIPPDGIAGLKRSHLIGATFELERDGPMQIFARCNLRHGPNTETLLRELPGDDGAGGRETVEFDLAYTEMNEKRVEAAWLDVILQVPAGRRLVIRDLMLYRRPRAEL